MKRDERHAPRSQGFMLVESMIAILFLGVAFAGLCPLTLTTMRSMDHAQRVTTATEFARDKIEDIRSVDYDAVTNGADVVEQGDAGAAYARTWIAVAGPTAGTKLVTVTVDPATRNIRPVSLQTIIAR